MMTEDAFIESRRSDWEELDGFLLRERALYRLPAASISRAAALFRALSTDLVRAQGAGFSAETIGYLDALAARAHNAMYSAPPYRLTAALTLFTRDFPRTLRRRAPFFALAAALLLIPALIGFWGGLASSSFSSAVLPEEMLESMEEAYSKNPVREASTNVLMAGFYVNNNIGIAFRCFATGVLFGLGSVFFLVYNGLVTGTVAGMLTRAGLGMNLLTFCASHSPFELTAVVVSGTAGLYMGHLLVVTGGRTRWGSLRAGARELFDLVMGAAGMLAVAAMIEGFWSASSAPATLKLLVAVGFSAAVGYYLGFAGRGTPGTLAAQGSRWS